MARIIEKQEVKRRQVVDRTVRMTPIRNGLKNLKEFLGLLPDNPLNKPALECCNRLAFATSVLEVTSTRYDKTNVSLEFLRPEFERSANEVATSKSFYDAKDAELFRKNYVEHRQKEAKEKAEKKVADMFGAQAGAAAAKAVEALQAYDLGLVKQRVVHTGLLPTPAGFPNVSVDQMSFHKMKMTAESWSWERRANYLKDLNTLFQDNEPELEFAELILGVLVQEWEANPPPARAGDRSGTREETKRQIGVIKRLIEQRRASRAPEWLKLHDGVVWPAVATLHKSVVGLDVRTMPAAQLAMLYKGEGRKPWDVMEGWQARYATADARALLNRSFDLNQKYSIPGTPTFSEALNQLKAAKG